MVCGARIAFAIAMLGLTGCACNDRPQVISPVSSAFGAGIPVSSPVHLNAGALPEGVTASFPAFDGDAFSAVLPAQPLMTELSSSEALAEIAPILRAAGFERDLKELEVPGGPIRLSPPDLTALAGEVCREALLERDPPSRAVCDAMRGSEPSAAAEAAIQGAYGVTFAEFRRELERPVLQYVFPQLVGEVPIEGSGVIATRQEGEGLSVVHGTLFNRFVVTNRPAGERGPVLDAARRALGGRVGEGETVETAGGNPGLVLVAHGSGRLPTGEEVPALRHAWRTLLVAPGGRESWMAWIDAETGAMLDLRPQWAGVEAQGERWRRDPGLSLDPTEVASFQVDPASNGRYVLALDDAAPKVFRRLDLLGDGDFDDGEVSLPDVPAADFDVPPINDAEAAICRSGGNSAFRQVHAYSHLYSFWKTIVSAGTIPRFPEQPIRILLDYEDEDRSVAFYDGSILQFAAGKGFLNEGCPTNTDQRLNAAHDTTILTHEMAHLSTKRLQDRRLDGWCKPAPADPLCPLPEGRELFHDFADALALAYASTDCFAGWTDKNWTGEDRSLYCKRTSEGAGYPRWAHVSDAPALSSLSEDRFPEHRAKHSDEYADGQIAAAALWKIRQGMRSKAPAAGTLEYWVRLNRALWSFGFLRPTCTTRDRRNETSVGCDRDIYRYLQDLERRMLDQWASVSTGRAGGHTANKVLSGWARAGIFLVPFQCMDGKPTTQDPSACPQGESAGDAVIDVDDLDPDDDPEVDGVIHPEVDYVRRSGTGPRFRVWTGPHFRFNDGGNTAKGPSLCHSSYTVEVSSAPALSNPMFVKGTTATCYADVELPEGVWKRLKGASGTTQRIYYRVRTWDAAKANERISTSPGAGAFNVPPPFVVVNDTGKP